MQLRILQYQNIRKLIYIHCFYFIFYTFSVVSYQYVFWNENLHFQKSDISLLSQEVPRIYDLINNSDKKKTNICIAQISTSDSHELLLRNSQLENDKRIYYTSASYDLSEKLARKLSEKRENLHLDEESQFFSDSHICCDTFPLREDTKTFNEDVIQELYDYFADHSSFLCKELDKKLEDCRRGREEYLEKYALFGQTLKFAFELGELTPKLASNSDIDKLIDKCFLENEDIQKTKHSMLLSFERYKSLVGDLIRYFYHSETRFLVDFFKSNLYQELKSYKGDIKIRLHTYYDCCHRCKDFIVNGFYPKIREDFRSAASVMMVVSYNEPYECECKVYPKLNTEFCGVCSTYVPPEIELTDGVYFTKVLSDESTTLNLPELKGL